MVTDMLAPEPAEQRCRVLVAEGGLAGHIHGRRVYSPPAASPVPPGRRGCRRRNRPPSTTSGPAPEYSQSWGPGATPACSTSRPRSGNTGRGIASSRARSAAPRPASQARPTSVSVGVSASARRSMASSAHPPARRRCARRPAGPARRWKTAAGPPVTPRRRPAGRPAGAPDRAAPRRRADAPAGPAFRLPPARRPAPRFAASAPATRSGPGRRGCVSLLHTRSADRRAMPGTPARLPPPPARRGAAA